jgi:succinyl-CoA synthetase beta subunit
MPVTQFLVEQMIPAGGVELLVGVTCDPAHGYVLTLGAGGVLTEILQDSASLLIPAARGDIEGALAGLRIGPLLVGYRGSKPVDMAALMATIEAVQAYVMQHRPCEIEINPLICLSDAAIAADALIRTGESDDG